MPTVDVFDLNNQKVGEVELADAVFGAEVNEALLYEAVRHYLAGKRAGTHKTKTRHEVAGFRQEAVEAEGHGPRPHGFGAQPALAAWRHGARTGSRAITATSCRARCNWARCVRRFRRNCATAN